MWNSEIRKGVVKGLIVLVPSYATAFLTEKIIYVVPMLAATAFFAAAAFPSDSGKKDGHDDDNEEGDADGGDFDG